MNNINIINLSTGLEFVEINPDGFCRLQSSQLESKAWQRFIDSVDNNMLYNLSIGNVVNVFDCGSRRKDGMSRVIWQGLPLIKYVCEKAWGLPIEKIFFKETNVTTFVTNLRLDISKYKYFRKHLNTKTIKLVGHYKKSKLDGKPDSKVVGK